MSTDAAPESLLAETARTSLATYIALVHKTDRGRPAIPPAHIREQIIPVLEDDSLGHTVIIAPPASAKTNTMIAACGWWLGRNPNEHIGYVCDTAPRAYERSVAVRDTIEENPNYAPIFPGAKPDKAKGWGEGEWFLWRPDRADKDASFLALGVGGSILGWRGDRLVLDDIANEENMNTELQRERIRRWLSKTILTRMRRPSRVVMIGTRWHEEDPIAWAMGQGWHVVHIRALDDAGRSYWPQAWPARALRCPGGCAPDPEQGKCFYDEEIGQWVNCKYRESGSLGFAQQYQGEAVSDETAIFKRGWWRRYREVPADATLGCITIDTAGWDEKSTTSDRAVLAVWVTDGRQFWCKDVVAGRMSFPEVERAAKDLRAAHGLPIVVEDVPWAKPLIQTLDRQTWGVVAWKVAGRSKLNRAKAVQATVEAGNCFLPEDAPWVGDFIEEHAVFPNGTHDDRVDTTVMALMYLTGMKPKRKPSRPARLHNWSRVRA